MEVVPGVPDEVTCTLPNFFIIIFFSLSLTPSVPSAWQDCIICMDQLSNPSGYETQPPAATAGEGGQGILPDAVGKFVKCGHTLHMLCMLAMYNNGTKVRDAEGATPSKGGRRFP